MMDDQERIVWFKNKLQREKDASVNILSGTAQFGLNVFEGIRCYRSNTTKNLNAFRLSDHLKRLEESCKLINLKCPDSIETFTYNIKKTIIANNFSEDVAVRLTVICDGPGSWYSEDHVTYFIAPILKPRKQFSQIDGISAGTSNWRRISDDNMPPRAKVGANYINSRYAYLQSRHDGYDAPIFLDQNGKVSEGAGACIVLIKDGVLITPSVTSSILESITRDTILKLAQDMDVSIEERVVDKTELYLADEAFFCGTAAEITPIKKVDRFVIGKNGDVGPMTYEIFKRYLSVVSGDLDKYSDWLTEVIL